MDIFYTPPAQINKNTAELKGQEAIHATKALRYSKGDEITVVDGQGTYYKGTIRRAAKDFVHIEVSRPTERQKQPGGKLAVGIIKKKSRLKFIVEKATELGIREIIFFRGEHSVKQNIRPKRLKLAAISAMKQSLQAWLPGIKQFDSLQSVIQHYPGHHFIAARQMADKSLSTIQKDWDNTMMLAGPEGGFSADEFTLLKNHEAGFVSLGPNRLRTETAALSMLVQFSSSV